VIEATVMDRRWQLVLDCMGAEEPPFSKGTLAGCRKRLIEHAPAYIGRWQGRRARYRGTRKNLFHLRRVAVVRNLHIIARQPDDGDCQLAA
jgi:hypothetical protein